MCLLRRTIGSASAAAESGALVLHLRESTTVGQSAMHMTAAAMRTITAMGRRHRVVHRRRMPTMRILATTTIGELAA